jgi:hypothetical protein
VNIKPTFPKPPYFEAFDLTAGLPSDVKANTCSLLLRVWRHTNSTQGHENYGTAWMSHDVLAVELHVSIRTTQDLFDDAWEKGLISREHFFKKKGKRIMSAEPYIKAKSHGMGEYLGSRYWVNWDVIRTAQAPKPPDGVAEIATPNSDGVAEIATPNNQIGVAEIATPVAKTATKGTKQCLVLTSPSKPTAPSASDTPIFPPAPDQPACATTVPHAGTSVPEAATPADADQHSTRCSSKTSASQTEPPPAVTCSQVLPAAAGASDEQRRGLQLQTAVSRIAKRKLGNHRRIPKNLTGKFELLALAHEDVFRDFGEWCDENHAAKRALTYPIHEYIKIVDDRLSMTPAQSAEAARVAEGVAELRALAYELTDRLTTKKQERQIAAALREIPVATLKSALTSFIQNLPDEPTSVIMNSFWTVSGIDAVLKAEHRLREAMDGDEDARKVKPRQHDLQALKRKVGAGHSTSGWC